MLDLNFSHKVQKKWSNKLWRGQIRPCLGTQQLSGPWLNKSPKIEQKLFSSMYCSKSCRPAWQCSQTMKSLSSLWPWLWVKQYQSIWLTSSCFCHYLLVYHISYLHSPADDELVLQNWRLLRWLGWRTRILQLGSKPDWDQWLIPGLFVEAILHKMQGESLLVREDICKRPFRCRLEWIREFSRVSVAEYWDWRH